MLVCRLRDFKNYPIVSNEDAISRLFILQLSIKQEVDINDDRLTALSIFTGVKESFISGHDIAAYADEYGYKPIVKNLLKSPNARSQKEADRAARLKIHLLANYSASRGMTTKEVCDFLNVSNRQTGIKIMKRAALDYKEEIGFDDEITVKGKTTAAVYVKTK